MKPFQKEKSGYMNSIETTHYVKYWGSLKSGTLVSCFKRLMKYSLVSPGQSPQNKIFSFFSIFFFDQQDVILIYSCNFCIISPWGMPYYNAPAQGYWETMEAALGVSIETHNPSRWPGSYTHCQTQCCHAKQCICQVRNMTHFLAPLRLQPIFKEHTLSFSEPFCLAYQVVTLDLIESWFGVPGNSSLINWKWYT